MRRRGQGTFASVFSVISQTNKRQHNEWSFLSLFIGSDVIFYHVTQYFVMHHSELSLRYLWYFKYFACLLSHCYGKQADRNLWKLAITWILLLFNLMNEWMFCSSLFSPRDNRSEWMYNVGLWKSSKEKRFFLISKTFYIHTVRTRACVHELWKLHWHHALFAKTKKKN